jgi:hypothetical protein
MPVSKMLEQVWRWKEAIHQETKDLSPQERIEYFRQATRRFEERAGRSLDLPPPRKEARGRPRDS